MNLSLFEDLERPSLAIRLAPILRTWADRGVFFGTSSWKYPGWLGSIYSNERYLTRNKFSKAKFEANCLSEYAETFPVVGGDFSFYQFPSPDSWAKVFAGTPTDFAFGLKVPEAVTVHQWPGHSRYGVRAGQPNEYFLDETILKSAFLQALEPYHQKVAVLIFEFGTFPKNAFAAPDEFLFRLERFLSCLSPRWRYAVEIRNPEYLGPHYFSLLARHNVAHVFNAWTRMPTIADQIARPGAFTADFTVVRALLQKGRTYEQAVSLFEPYQEVQQPDPSTRVALRQVADLAVRKQQKTFIFVNNRMEGNAPRTIEAVISDPKS